ncbi:MAG: hypothetical protein U5K72_04190 [Balneolaceae bacterium]|nr:hypothetical protein [Balneolaceae bacterium]
MSAKKQSKGVCFFCEREMTKGGMRMHLASCKERQQSIGKMKDGEHPIQNLYHLQVYDPYDASYWLNLEMSGAARLEALDDYLRAIWLECCGHLSQFYADRRYGTEIAMAEKVYSVFRPGTEITHIYDFGSSTELKITMVDQRRGKPLTSNPIFLMARNNLPEISCDECKKPAEWIDLPSLYETGEYVVLCTEHADSDSDLYEDECLPIVNSPRSGVCGYTGPAEPPY